MKKEIISYLLHVDMDSFFVSVEQILNPALRGKPVIVGGESHQRGVVACASYEARKYGIRAAMPVAKAKRLCPDVICVPGTWSQYSYYSGKVMHFLQQFTPAVEQVSIDEAYLNLLGTERLWGHPYSVALKIQQGIKNEIGLDATIGLGSNKLIAKIASDIAKPKGIVWILPEYETSFLSHLPIEAIPGIGPKTTQMLNELNIQTVQQFLSIPSHLVKQALGNNALFLYHKAQGIDYSMVRSEHEFPKSMGREITFHNDTEDTYYLTAVLHYLIEELCTRLRNHQIMCHTLTLKLRYSDFLTITKSCQLKYFSDLSVELFPVAKTLFLSAYTRRVKLRLIGISLSQLMPHNYQHSLFPDEHLLKWSRLNHHVDQIRKKYGFTSILNADTLAVPLSFST
ncbi:MAG: hypothetical protein A2Y62_16255 [Candidatus Fischerbacteria bacterium RBG_13_37_8]|uniref:DNA polymerase IV n=1 Tax=Candidatus Fischerbacteria bacterium RBG_13_37_8 TaxID=1817863 RepID=A0A1F5VWM0_9BACT|nr:MAG: hypothetical protein A2Y62_16255 [Candidatus Fischerbacteria bacterium RBG_13_37_8]